MYTFIVATKNKGKVRELRAILDGKIEQILTMEEAGMSDEIVEDGETFVANSIIKAKAVARKFPDAVIIADDSGLVIDALNGEPGVHSSRFMGEDTSYDIKNAAILDLLKEKKEQERSARYVCAIVAVIPGKEEPLIAEKTMEGQIADKPAGDGGFGFDPIFFLPEYKLTAAEIRAEEKNKISHRGKALQEMVRLLKLEGILA